MAIKWNSGCVDWKHKFINKSIENITKNLRKKNGIAVFHDYVPETAFNFSILIEEFSNEKNNNYHPFVSLEECLTFIN